MPPRSSAEIRDAFLSFFEERDHLRVPSASLIPASYDPSVLLTTAGMQPFKPYFLGQEQPPHPRLTSCQKCFRTTDIDEVGNTARHLTFFEMLGNFSFGDYFKEGAIQHAWELSTQVFGLDPDQIWITVFEGDPELGLGPDEEAIELWRAIGVPRDRIVGLPRSENFWQAGPTGPCGPSSELYIDRGPDFGPEGRPGDDTERYLEFWNLVFMQYTLYEDGRLEPLPTRNIDTGLGLERMASILQDVPSVYETDNFRPLVELGEQLSGRRYGSDPVATKALRVLADHSRASTFLIADGVAPSNEDRGYILRRIMRRAIQQGRAIGLEPPFLGKFADTVIEIMGPTYPELVSERNAIHQWLSSEEESFGRTLEQGTKLLADIVARAKEQSTSWIDADDAFRLHDTYGFPYDLTRELLQAEGLAVDDAGFHELMEEQRERARTGAARATGSEHEHEQVREFARGAGFPTRFVGYETTEIETSVGALGARRRFAFDEVCGIPLLRGGGRPGRGLGSGGERLRRGPRAGRLPPRRRPGRGPAGGARRAARGRARTADGRPHGAARDRVQPHRDPPPARRAATAPRYPRAPGRLGRAPRQAALRLHARQAAHPRGAARDRGPGERLDPREPSRARDPHDAHARGGDGRDGAVR